MKVSAIIAAVVSSGFAAVGCSAIPRDAPERSFSLPNDTGSSRIVHRCIGIDDCQSPKKGDTVEPRDTFEFEIYADEERSYVITDAQGKTLGCLTIHSADGAPPPPPESLADARIAACPPGTPAST